MKKIGFFFVFCFNKITEDRLLSIFHHKKLRNIIVQVKCKKTRGPSSYLHVLKQIMVTVSLQTLVAIEIAKPCNIFSGQILACAQRNVSYNSKDFFLVSCLILDKKHILFGNSNEKYV